MSKTKIRVINVKFYNEKLQSESLIKTSECINNEYFININKSFNSISSEVIRDEVVFMPICKKGYCMFSICSFRLDEKYEANLLKKINEIVVLYLNSEIENYEEEIKEIDNKIVNIRNIICELEKKK